MQALARVVGWIIVVAFALTASVTLLALIGVLKLVNEIYLNRLFGVLVVEIIGAGFYLFYAGLKQTLSTYCEDFMGTIHWYPDYAETIFNYQGGTKNFQPLNPRSEGHLHFYKSRAGVYKGFSLWETKNGELTYSKLVVIPAEFEFDSSSGKLRRISLSIALRQKLRDFSYGPFTHYQVEFIESSDFRLRGRVLLVKNGNGVERKIEIGDIILERE